jgi:hypothetical protein
VSARRPAARRARAMRSRRRATVVWGAEVLRRGGIRGVELVKVVAPIVLVGKGVVVFVLAQLRRCFVVVERAG